MQSTAYLEHTNLTVDDPQSTADLFRELFDWRIRWSGASMDEGFTVHVGNDSSYLALYTNPQVKSNPEANHSIVNNLNHVALVVPDLDAVEQRVRARGLEPFNFADYAPGKRFYFYAAPGLEVEVVSYDS